MIKFMVVIYRRPDLTHEQFRRHLQEVHGPLAKNLPGLRKYIQNIVGNDPRRKPPAWDAIVDPISTITRAWKRRGQAHKVQPRTRTCRHLLT
ncbi:MAG: EthD family reductase [Candidatus Sulfotelmatobacter sp.]